MSEAIQRDIYVLSPQRVPPIQIVADSKIPIELTLKDLTIPTGATIKAYARGDDSDVTYVVSCTWSGNVVTVTPTSGFFVEGYNQLQIEINGTLIPLAILVDCGTRVSDIPDGESTPETVKPLVDQAREILAECKEISIKTPYVGDNGNWLVWDSDANAYKDTGINGNGTKVTAKTVQYQSGASGTTAPTGTWSDSVPTVAQGSYLWTKVTLTYNDGTSTTFYSCARQGKDGSGSVSSVCGQSPDSNGNVALTASNVGALSSAAGAVKATNIASAVKSAAVTVSIAASAWSDGAATVSVTGVTASNHVIVSPAEASRESYAECGVRCTAQTAGKLTFKCDTVPTAALSVNVLCINL